MSPGLAIVLIIVVWLLVLAPVLLRGQKPMSRTGEAFEDTRVLFEGDSGSLETTRGPKLSAKAARIKARKEANEASANAQANSDEATIEEPAAHTDDYAEAGTVQDVTKAAQGNREESEDREVKAEKQTIAGAAARIKSEYDNAESDKATSDQVQDSEEETIEGEIVYEVELADAEAQDNAVNTKETPATSASADVVDAEFTDAEPTESTIATAVTGKDANNAEATPINAVLSDDDVELLDEVDDILLEDEPREKTPSTGSEDDKVEGVSASEGQVFTAPAAYKVAEDAYEMDETYVSPVDMMYPGAVDSERVDSPESEEVAAQPTEDEESEASGSEIAMPSATEVEKLAGEGESEFVAADADSELSEEELEFAQARVGRGGWDPEADAANKATRYQRRQRTLMGLAIVVVLTVALGIIFGGWLWWTASIAGALTIAYLIALRTQVRQEQQLRARRISQLRRARLGVRSAQDEELAIPRSLRRPGAVIVEIDDNSPDWDHLPEMYEEVDDAPDRPASRRQRRDDLAARRVG